MGHRRSQQSYKLKYGSQQNISPGRGFQNSEADKAQYISENKKTILHPTTGSLRFSTEQSGTFLRGTLPRPRSVCNGRLPLVWNNWTVFIHPPIVLIPRIPLKIKGVLYEKHFFLLLSNTLKSIVSISLSKLF